MTFHAPLATHIYSCERAEPLLEPIVLLHGWGSASEAWQPLIPALQKIAQVIAIDMPGFGKSSQLADYSLNNLLELIERQLPEKSILLGWSLGGMLAVQLAARCPQGISRLVTLAANVKFVASSAYLTAMPLSVNRKFNNNFAADGSVALKLFSSLLAQGDASERSLLKKVRALAEPNQINSNWLDALKLLAELDNRTTFTQLTQPGLHLLGQQDVLVPSAAAEAIAALNAAQQVHVISGAAHALHWSQPELIAKTIVDFLMGDFHSAQHQTRISFFSKQNVAQSFSRAAQSYDSVANLQRAVGATLLEKINQNADAEIVMDLGCGTGYFLPELQQKFPRAQIIGVDIAEGMLQFSRNRHHNLFHWLCADAEQLPFADKSVDCIFSSLSLQWCANLPQLFAELKRVLKPSGELVFATLGPRTLYELKMAWQQVDHYVHVNNFHSAELLQAQLGAHGFTPVEFSSVESILEFATLAELTRSLKALGAHNVNDGRAVGLTGRKKIQAFKQAYENFRRNNVLPATYDVFYVRVKN